MTKIVSPKEDTLNHIRKLKDKSTLCSDPDGKEEFVLPDYDEKPYCLDCMRILSNWLGIDWEARTN